MGIAIEWWMNPSGAATGCLDPSKSDDFWAGGRVGVGSLPWEFGSECHREEGEIAAAIAPLTPPRS